MKKVSLIILSFNTKNILKECIQSVLKEIKGFKNYELVIIDNGSTDGSVDYINGLKVKAIFNKENLGFAKAVNQGIKKSTGELIFLLNSDTIIQENFFKSLIEFEKTVTPAIIGVKFLNPNREPQASVFHFPTISGAISEFWLGKDGSYQKYVPESEMPLEVEAVSGGGMLISKEIIEKIGLLDERFFFYFEDLEYCRRARKNGFKVYYYPQAKLIHKHGASGVNLAKKEEQWKRLIPSSKVYNGLLKHYLITIIIWGSQKWKKIFHQR